MALRRSYNKGLELSLVYKDRLSSEVVPTSKMSSSDSKLNDWQPRPDELLRENDLWAKEINESHPEFFEQSARGQYPKVCAPGRPQILELMVFVVAQVLWIGCSDSRMPESVITKSMPGSIFVHRNIAK